MSLRRRGVDACEIVEPKVTAKFIGRFVNGVREPFGLWLDSGESMLNFGNRSFVKFAVTVEALGDSSVGEKIPSVFEFVQCRDNLWFCAQFCEDFDY